MGLWILAVLLGAGAVSGFYMAFLAFRIGDSGVYLFLVFGLLFGALFFSLLIKAASKRSALHETAEDKISLKPGPVRFVPHMFLMWAIVIAGACIVAAVLIPIIFR